MVNQSSLNIIYIENSVLKENNIVKLSILKRNLKTHLTTWKLFSDRHQNKTIFVRITLPVKAYVIS